MEGWEWIGLACWPTSPERLTRNCCYAMNISSRKTAFSKPKSSAGCLREGDPVETQTPAAKRILASLEKSQSTQNQEIFATGFKSESFDHAHRLGICQSANPGERRRLSAGVCPIGIFPDASLQAPPVTSSFKESVSFRGVSPKWASDAKL